MNEIKDMPDFDINLELERHYINPEELDPETIEKILREGEIHNIRPIESLGQEVKDHADKVLIGNTRNIPHGDAVLEGEIDFGDKTMLVVYKPESGINKGTDTGKVVPIPTDSSPYHNKEQAAWQIAKHLQLDHLLTPVLSRSLNEGLGSIRAYLFGSPLEIVDDDVFNKAYDDEKSTSEIAMFDYLIQTLDRRNSNLIYTKTPEGNKLKLIDHSLTFFDENAMRRWHIKGPRLMVAYDNTTSVPSLRNKPLPDILSTQLQRFVDDEDVIRQELSNILNIKEIDGVFRRAKKMLEQKIFL